MTDFKEPFTVLRQWAVSNPVLAFPLIYIGWAYLFWSPLLLSEMSVWGFPGILWFLLAAVLVVLWWQRQGSPDQ